MANPKDDLIGALLLKAKENNGAESDNAMKALKRLCKKHDIDIEAVLSGDEELEEFHVRYKKGQHDLMVQVICRYGFVSIKTQELWGNSQIRSLTFKTTKQKYVEVLNAYEVLSPLLRKELKKMKRAFFFGFLDKHNLYYQPKKDEIAEAKLRIGKESEEELQRKMDEQKSREMGAGMSRHMEDATITKRLN